MSDEDITEALKGANDDPLVALLAIVQAAVTDETFNAGTVKYLLESLDMGYLWENAVTIEELEAEDDDDVLDDPDLTDDSEQE